MRVLITGGAGFIGSHLCDRYLARGDEVIVIDDLSTGSILNIRHLKNHPKFRYLIDSVHNQSVMAELVDESDMVVHLMAAVGVKLIVKSPVRTMQANVDGTQAVLEHTAKKNKRVLIASTSEVYGLSTKIPFNENDPLVLGASTKGRWSYACSKLLDEFLALAYHNEKNVPVTVVRLFNTVGPRQTGRYGMVIPTFVSQALAGKPITVYGDGSQSRCFGYVRDVTDALVRLMDRQSSIGEVYNIGSTEEVSIAELAEIVKVQANSESEIQTIPYDQAYSEGFEDMPRRVPDTSKIDNLIGFDPQTTLEQIIQHVIQYQLGGQVEDTSTTQTAASRDEDNSVTTDDIG